MANTIKNLPSPTNVCDVTTKSFIDSQARKNAWTIEEILEDQKRKRDELHAKHPHLKEAWEQYEILRILTEGNVKDKSDNG